MIEIDSCSGAYPEQHCTLVPLWCLRSRSTLHASSGERSRPQTGDRFLGCAGPVSTPTSWSNTEVLPEVHKRKETFGQDARVYRFHCPPYSRGLDKAVFCPMFSTRRLISKMIHTYD